MTHGVGRRTQSSEDLVQRFDRIPLSVLAFKMRTMMTIRKAVFPVAGFGTRFLPATKAMPKELLPIVDKPLIQYAAEEAVAAGIDTLIFVTGRNKRVYLCEATRAARPWPCCALR